MSDELVDRLANRLVVVLGDTREAIHQIFEWLGSATWPAEAVAGDGQLARRLLERFGVSDVAAELALLSEPRQLMGAVAWAAFQQDDAPVMGAVGPALPACRRGPDEPPHGAAIGGARPFGGASPSALAAWPQLPTYGSGGTCG